MIYNARGTILGEETFSLERQEGHALFQTRHQRSHLMKVKTDTKAGALGRGTRAATTRASTRAELL